MLAAAALLFFALAISSMRQKSATYDEPVYVIAGLSYLALHDYTMKDDAPPLVAYLAGLSARAQGLEIPGGELPFQDSLGHEYPYAVELLYGSGADADAVLFWSRISLLLPFGLLLLATVWLWASALYGPAAGGVALLLVALSPNLLAHGRIVSADFPCTAAMLFASYLLWRFTVEASPGRAVAAGLGLGLALVTKFTALVLLPCTAVVLALLVLRTPGRRRASVAGASLLVLVPAALAIALVYGWPPQPERYASGVRAIYRNLEPDYPWFLFGSLHSGGVRYYALAALAVKTSLPLLALGLAGLVALPRRQAGLLAELCLLLPAAVLLAAASFDPISSGIRRILPALPVLAIAGSRCVALAPRPSAKALAPVLLLLVLHGVSSLRAWPHYIPYFNELALALQGEGALLDDSDIDWGQDLKALPAVLERHGIDWVYLRYFGTADPAYYGIRFRTMDTDWFDDPPPGIYAISLQYLIRFQAYGYPWLSQRRPFDRAGTSILLYRVGTEG